MEMEVRKPKTGKSLRERVAEAKTRKTKPKVQTLEERVAGLEKKLKTTQEKLKATQTEMEQLAGLEKKLKTTQKTLKATQVKLDTLITSVVNWSDDVDRQLQEVDQRYRNLAVHAWQNDPGPSEKSSGSLRCRLADLMERGAIPINADAAGIFKGPIP
jgi:chromosome segregation ATPase